LLKTKIIEAKNSFGIKAAEIIAKHYKLDKWDEHSLKGCCPFHEEKTPSFIWNKKDNAFKCFSCGRRIGILDIYLEQGLSYQDAVQKLFSETNIEFSTLDFKHNKDEFFKNYKFPVPEANEDRETVENYYSKRHISKETLDYAEIKQDEHGNAVFEHKRLDGVIVAIKYRPARTLKKSESKMWWQKGASTCPILYGIDKIDITQPLVICEGHSDYLAIIESGWKNVVSIPHGAEDLSWVEFNWEWLENFDDIRIWSDNDYAGKKMRSESVIRLGEHRCKIIDPDSTIEDKVEEFYKSLSKNSAIRKTDANNVLMACGKQEVLNLIFNAKEIPIPDVVKLMECPEFDINKAEIFSTGTNELDQHIYGHILSTLNIWTGRTGGGKSTYLIGSCVLPVIDANESTFIYSGELTASQLKNWVMLQLAGRKHIIEWDNGEHKPKTYSVTKEAKKAIEKKYNDLIYLYDSYLIATPDKVINRMEYLRKKHGVKNYIIDNLMCFELDINKYGNELNAQKNLIIQFLQFAVRYNCVVHLVAHPRKADGSVALNEYDILGSSNIPNLAHRIFSLRRTDKKEKDSGIPYDAYVSILKDRILGVTKKEVGLYYDPPSRRMYGDADDLMKDFSWDTGSIKYNDQMGSNGKVVNYVTEQEEGQFGKCQTT
jgi:hypothetical protein